MRYVQHCIVLLYWMSGSNPFASPSRKTDGHKVWRYKTRGEFTATVPQPGPSATWASPSPTGEGKVDREKLGFMPVTGRPFPPHSRRNTVARWLGSSPTSQGLRRLRCSRKATPARSEGSSCQAVGLSSPLTGRPRAAAEGKQQPETTSEGSKRTTAAFAAHYSKPTGNWGGRGGEGGGVVKTGKSKMATAALRPIPAESKLLLGPQKGGGRGKRIARGLLGFTPLISPPSAGSCAREGSGREASGLLSRPSRPRLSLGSFLSPYLWILGRWADRAPGSARAWPGLRRPPSLLTRSLAPGGRRGRAGGGRSAGEGGGKPAEEDLQRRQGSQPPPPRSPASTRAQKRAGSASAFALLPSRLPSLPL